MLLLPGRAPLFITLLLPVTALPLLLPPAWSASAPAPHQAFPAAMGRERATLLYLQQNQVLLKYFTAVSWLCGTIIHEAHVAKLHFAALPHLPATALQVQT